jgi:uncharacterized membrane protein HdeD (DUF308 family)
MTNTNQPIVRSDVTSLQRHWGWLLFLGILLFFMGSIGLGMEVMLTLVSMYFIAALLLVSGLSHVVDGFKYKHLQGALWQLLIALLYLLAGIVVLYDPLLASTLITAFLAWVFIIIGFSRVFLAFHLKNTLGWGWVLFSGITSLILGILILIQWPLSSLWVIGMFISIDLLIIGWTYIFMAIALRCAKKEER